MLKFIVNLFELSPELPKERKVRPLRSTIKTNDAFGQTIQVYLDRLSDSEQMAAKKTISILIKAGHSTLPAKNWTQFHELQHSSNRHISNWWLILQNYFDKQNGHISLANISFAKGIIWYTIRSKGVKSTPNVLHFLSNCQDTYSYNPKVSAKLANAAVDMLVREPYFYKWDYEIHRYYPNLLYGFIGKKMEQAWARTSQL